jgi:hypothetical protein
LCLISENQYDHTSIIDSKITTLINVFTIDPKNQQYLVDLLIEAAEKVINQQEEFI